ncbi:MAG: S41 family peptidase [Planctomycetota bacterium]
MPLRPILAVLAAVLLLVASSFASAGLQRGRKATPFDGIRWSRGAPEVLVDAEWYEPLVIHGVAVSDVLAFCDKRWPGQREKRFTEDLAEAIERMGHELPQAVSLDLRRLSDGEAITLTDVPCTAAKRTKLVRAARERSEARPTPAVLSMESAEADLQEFAERLRDQFAYLEWKGIDLDEAVAVSRKEIEAAREGSNSDVPTAALAEILDRLLMRFGDGHARVRSDAVPRSERWLPTPRLEIAGDGYVAVRPDRSVFFSAGRPYVVAIDGRPIDDWVDAVRSRIPAGSEQMVRFVAAGRVADLDRGRAALGIEPSDSVEITFAKNARGRGKKSETFDVARRSARADRWLERETGWLETRQAKRVKGGVGYIRLPRMDDDLVPELRRAMGDLASAGGLVVDVRGNGGGLRGLLLALAGYLVDPDGPPVVANVAAYRKSERFRDDHLGGSRHLYRADDPYWSEAEKAAIAAFAENFEPEWALPDGFSEWHYLLLRPTGHEEEYHFTKPVVVLCDAGCFSATDIFLGGLERLPNVTLVGRASGGGSARSQGFTLTHSGIEVRCASMASFRPDGRTYDGRGVEVDVEVPREAGDLLRGGGDAQLDAAVEVIRKRAR